MKELLIIFALIAGCDEPPSTIPYKCKSTESFLEINEWTGNAFTFACPIGTSLTTRKMAEQPRGLLAGGKIVWEIYCECEK